MNIFFIIQARVGSTRLPGKILLPFYNNKSILDLLIEKLATISNVGIIVATSLAKENDAIEEVAIRHCVKCFRGAENDVLKRFVDAANYVGAQHIIRICSDNPFLQLDSVKKLIEISNNSEEVYDYISYDIQGCPSIKTHYGFWTEYVSLSALKGVMLLTDESIYREHVTNFIYQNPDKFRIKWLTGHTFPTEYKDVRLTIDTETDFRVAQSIYRDLCSLKSNPTIDEIISYLGSHSDYYQSMKTQKIKNSK